jgi:hypothetical protein
MDRAELRASSLLGFRRAAFMAVLSVALPLIAQTLSPPRADAADNSNPITLSANAPMAPASSGPALPAQGAWFGTRLNGDDWGLGEDDAQAVGAFERQVGRKMTFERVYHRWSDEFPDAQDYEHRDQGRILFLSWSGAPWAEIANGSYDNLIDARAADLKAFGAPLFFSFNHEPEMDQKMLGSPADFVAAYRRIHARFVANGVTNVSFAPTFMAISFKNGNIDSFYPGDAYIDVLAADGYNQFTCKNGISWRTFKQIFQYFVAFGNAHAKPMVIPEYGSLEDPADPNRRAQWLSDAAETLKGWPGVKAISYYDHDVPPCYYRLDSSATALNSYAAMGADPHFNPSPPAVLVTEPTGLTNSASATVRFQANYGPLTYTCALDEGPPAPCTSGVTYHGLAEGGHKVTVVATDEAGNTGRAFTSWTVDATPPVIDIGRSPRPVTNDTSVEFGFSSNESGTTFRCALDGGAPLACSSPVDVSGVTDGAHTFSVTGIDAAGNASVQSAGWTQDTRPPELAVTGGPSTVTNSKSATWTFTADEPATFKCSKEEGSFWSCAGSYSWDWMSEGSHTLSVVAVDEAGNTSEPYTQSWSVDTTRPTATLTSAPPQYANLTSASFAFSSTEPAAFGCALDGAAPSVCASPVSYSSLPEGGHTWTVYATDAAGNIQGTSHDWTVDVTPPAVNIWGTPKTVTNANEVEFGFSSNESGMSYLCSIDRSAPASCTSPVEYAGLADGTHTFTVRGTDRAGNTSSASFGWAQETVPPVLTVSGGPAAYTNSKTATWTFAASEPASFKCSKDGATFWSCANPFTWNWMSDGAHTLAVTATDAAGNISAPSTRSFVVDTVKPTVTINSGPASRATGSSVTFRFTASESNVVFDCALDGGAWVRCTSPMTYTTIALGSHRFSVRGTDRAGNVSAAATWSWSRIS